MKTFPPISPPTPFENLSVVVCLDAQFHVLIGSFVANKKTVAPHRVRPQSASDLSRRETGELSDRPDVDEARENYPHYR